MRKICVVAALGAVFLWVSPASAAKCYVKEYASSGNTRSNLPLQIASEPGIVDQTAVDFTSGHAESVAFSAQTTYIRLWCDAQASYIVGKTPLATNAMSPIGASTPEYFGVQPGDKISVVANP
jgi:hypothetical protein